MLALLIEGQEDSRRFVVDRRELGRAGPSFTIDTVRELELEFQGAALHLILGSDNLAALPSWHSVEELLLHTTPIVIFREGDPREVLDALGRSFSSVVLAKLERGFLRLPPVAASSSGLRAILSEGGIPGSILPAAVHAYIRARGLYGSSG